MANQQDSTIAALSEDHIVRITGLSKGQLRAWDKLGFFEPNYAYSDRSKAYSRIYSFKDAVGLRAISVLKKQHNVSQQHLVKVAKLLSKKGFSHWSDVKLFVIKRKVHFQHPSSNKVEGVEDGQFAMLEVIKVIDDVLEKVSILKMRQPNQIGKIDRNKFVARNSWVVSGTRIPTATIRRYIDAGFNEDQIIEEYPALTYDDIRAAVKHEKRLAKSA